MPNYKNQLQEIAQKRRIDLPKYELLNSMSPFRIKVLFDGREYHSGSHPRKIDAEQDAAKIAVEALGMSEPEDPQVPTRVLQGKNGLQEYCVKMRISPPQYSSYPTMSGFLATVTVNDEQFNSDRACSKKTEAEINAADVALNYLQQRAPLPSTNMKPVTRSWKNDLIDWCQKSGRRVPYPEATSAGPDHMKVWTASVIIDGKEFHTDGEFPRKIDAEQEACRIAFEKLAPPSSHPMQQQPIPGPSSQAPGQQIPISTPSSRPANPNPPRANGNANGTPTVFPTSTPVRESVPDNDATRNASVPSRVPAHGLPNVARSGSAEGRDVPIDPRATERSCGNSTPGLRSDARAGVPSKKEAMEAKKPIPDLNHIGVLPVKDEKPEWIEQANDWRDDALDAVSDDD
eukprot:TRINITY_DN378_c0_g1_i1.p1 TRINITY_DN378_c0_g1~~TRINITY_DN378_c0_g1_i1.p1  ORF type:complete len:402 (-),score=45.32 TRINITY_DN378_c0_g1_i1:195-1400(-)